MPSIDNNNSNKRSFNPIKGEFMEFPLFDIGKTVKDDYDVNGLIDLLASVPFDKISVPLYTYKDLIFGEGKKGTTVVGYIKSFDVDNLSFSVYVNGKNLKVIKEFDDAVVFPRVRVRDGEANMVIGLDVCPYSKYEYLDN